MKRYSKHLSKEFQPSVFFDFGEGKIMSNKFAESLRPFCLTTGEELKAEEVSGQYLYFVDATLDQFVVTDEVCPRSAMNIGGNESNNIKVNVANVRVLKEGSGVKFLVGGDIETELAYRPSVIAMPQYATIVRDDTEYNSDNIKPVDGELYTIVVEPDIDTMSELYYPRHQELNDVTFNSYIRSLIRRSTVLLCADKRFFKWESYDEYGNYYPEHSYDSDIDTRFKFKMGDIYCDFIYMGVGSIIKLRSVVEKELIDGVEMTNVYWIVENHPCFVPIDHEIYVESGPADDVILSRIEPKVCGSRIVADALSNMRNGYRNVEYHYRLSDDTKKDWRDRVIDLYAYDDITNT